MSKIKKLAQSGLSIVKVMATSIVRGVQPLQYRGLPMWHYNGEDDASRCGRKGLDTPAALAKILVELFKGEDEEFLRIKRRDGFSMYIPPSWVSPHPSALLTPLLNHFPRIRIRPFITVLAKDLRGASQLRPAARGPQPRP